jgi:hypothetical protein
MEMNQQGESAFEEYVRAANADPGNEWLLINVSRQLIEKDAWRMLLLCWSFPVKGKMPAAQSSVGWRWRRLPVETLRRRLK